MTKFDKKPRTKNELGLSFVISVECLFYKYVVGFYERPDVYGRKKIPLALSTRRNEEIFKCFPKQKEIIKLKFSIF